MAIGALIRDLRRAKGWSQGELARRLAGASGSSIGREYISKNWESGKAIPGVFWLTHLSRVLGVPSSVLESEASLTRVNRRAFVSLTALTATHGKLASELVSSIAGSDTGPLTTVQTSHGTDLTVAALADSACRAKLRSWMADGEDALLRVNAAGILAKVPGQDLAAEVVKTLAGDAETRHLYLTAVTARVCALDWATAGQLAADPLSMPSKASFLALRFASEVTNPLDAGARWCSAVMLRDLSPLLGR